MDYDQPRVLGAYRLDQAIAIGGMARTWRAHRLHDPTRQPVCVKVLHKELGDDADFIRMFVDEANIAASLQHPNIVHIFERGIDHGQHFIAMELADGKDLKQITERAARLGLRIPPAVAALIARDLCSALHYVHTRTDAHGQPMGIIHRDISPHNVMITWDGAVKLTDFGIAKAAQRLTQTAAGAVKGKFGYMSPEQVSGKPLDGRSDLFAVGILLHEMLTGQPLFDSESGVEAFAMILEHPIPPPSRLAPGIDVQLDRICLSALERHLQRRYPSCARLQADLDAWLRHQPSPPPPQRPLARPLRRSLGPLAHPQRPRRAPRADAHQRLPTQRPARPRQRP